MSVGEHVVDEMESFLELSKYVDLSKLGLVYTNPDSAPLPPKNKDGEYRVDVINAFLINIALQKANEDFTEDDFNNLGKYCIRLKKAPWVQTLITALGLMCKSFAKQAKDSSNDASANFIQLMLDNYGQIYTDISELTQFDPRNISK